MMTAMKPVLDFVVDANVVFFVAFGLWAVTQYALSKSKFRDDYGLQLRLLRVVFLCVIFSPLLSIASVNLSNALWGSAPFTVSDIAVAAYLRGDIAMPAVQFEQILNTRSHFFDSVLAGEMPLVTSVIAALAIGGLVLFFGALKTIGQVNHLVSESYVWRQTRSTDIRFSDTVTVPFAFRGLFRRHVVLPSELILKPKELRVVLAHEFEHLRQGDVEWELFFEFVRPLLYWNPVFLLWKRAFTRLRELSCDQAVLESLKISPREYARCLLNFCGRPAHVSYAERMNVGLVRTRTLSGKRALEDRLLALARNRKAYQSNYVLCGATMVLAVGVFLAAASVRNPSDWSHDRLMLSTVVNLERMEAYGF